MSRIYGLCELSFRYHSPVLISGTDCTRQPQCFFATGGEKMRVSWGGLIFPAALAE